MNRFFAVLQKEILILLRDKAGLSLLFLMPAIFIFIMTVIQDSTYKALYEIGVPVIIVDEDGDQFSNEIIEGLKSSKFCKISTEIEGKKATYKNAFDAVSKGTYTIGIFIPKNTSESIRKNVATIISSTLSDSVQASDFGSGAEIKLFYDPTAKASFIIAVTTTLNSFIENIKSKLIFDTFAHEIKQFIPSETTPNTSILKNLITLKEESAVSENSEIIPNSVQHNVPAWTIFGMFFIVVPLAGSILREKSEGSYIRLQTLPGSTSINFMGKLFVYWIICIVQFIIMMIVGSLLVLIDLPPLQIHINTLFPIGLLAITISICATGFGLLIGSISQTQQQTSVGAPILILILSALGGIWVPTHLMPPVMKTIASFSPLNWAIDGFYTIFLRGLGTKAILGNAAMLLCFGLFQIILSYFINEKSMKK